MRVWITKYALTSGIYTADATLCDDISDTMIAVETGGPRACFHGADWHRTKESALARAEEMRIAKLKSLDKQARRISSMKIEIVKWGAE